MLRGDCEAMGFLLGLSLQVFKPWNAMENIIQIKIIVNKEIINPSPLEKTPSTLICLI